MRLGIIGPEDLVAKSVEISNKYKSIDVVEIPYENESDTISKVREWENEVDSFLFTGFLPYYHATTNNVTSKQLFYYPILGSALYTVLLKIKMDNNINISNISIDTLNKSEIEEVFKEIDIPYEGLCVNDRELDDYSRDQYIDFHLKLYKSGRTEAAVTSINSVYLALIKKGIPAFKITPTSFAMNETFKLIESARETYVAQNNQIILIIIDIKDYSLNTTKPSSLDMREKKLSLHQELLNYSRIYKASVFSSADENEFIVLITKGIFQEYTNSYENIPMIHEIKEKFSMSINMGIGMGVSALEAEENARAALSLSKGESEFGAYVINQDKVVYGPIGADGRMEYILKSNDETLIGWMNKTGISIANISLIQNLISKLQTDCITPSDIQKGLNITLRSANRIMNKLVMAGAAEDIGIEQPVGRGRPRHVYKIDFSKDKLL
ncbi:hypothetical protein GCM10008905_00860 [Clostridium malenominatum]|uniref:Transcriptional regulator n=1 Tax=Clostridium malenominatum TaxID=1539 RepID=A0ABP3TV99_9CLOT